MMQEKKNINIPGIRLHLSKDNLHYLREQAKKYGFKVVGKEVNGEFGVYLMKNNQLYSKVC